MKKLMTFLAVILLTGSLRAAQTEINVPLQEHAAALDQLADPAHLFWQQAARLYGMTEFTKGVMAKNDCTLSLAATADALYLQVVAFIPEGHQLRMAEKNRDGKVYFDDCVEIALALPGKKDDEYYQITINPANVLYDAYRINRSWNGQLTTVTKIKKDCWVATFRIPYSDLELDKMPAELRFNMARTLCGANMEQTVLVRNHTGLYFGKLQDAVALKFGVERPTVNLAKLDSENGGIRAAAIVLPEEKFADFTLKVFDLKGKKVFETTGQARFDSKQSDLEFPQLPDGKYIVEFAMIQAREYIIPAYYGGGREPNPKLQNGEKPQQYFFHRWPITVDNAPMITTAVKLREEGRKLIAAINPRAVICSEEAFYRLSVRTTDGKIVKELGTRPFKNGVLSFSGDLTGFPERTRYVLHTELVDDNEVLLTADTAFATPPAPVWKKQPNPDRPDVNKVPAPWTPVELNGLTVKCWNREYRFAANSLVPQQIVSSNTDLLAAPAQVVSEPAIKWDLVKVAKLNAGTVRLDYLGKTATGVEVKAFSEVYYDGVVRTDLEIPENAVFSKLYLELPYQKDVALFSHQGPGIFGGMFNIRQISKSEKYTFIPNYMLVNDNVGLGWFDGMPFNWPLADVSKVVEMTPQADRSIVRVNYIDNNKAYPVARRYSWGLQSFPARPLPENEEAMRLCYIIRYGDEDRAAWYSQVEYFAPGNVDITKGSLEIKFMVPANSGEDFIAQMRHGDASEFQLMVSPDGRLQLREREYFSVRWNLFSRKALTPGVWHHAAVNWGNGQIELYLDGQLQDTLKREQLLRIMPTRILVGGKKTTVDELRIDKLPRKSFAVNCAPVPEANTLLCDNFDTIDYCNGRRATVPAKVDDEAEAGYLMFDTNIVPGIRSQAVGPMTVPVRNMVEGYAMMGVQAMCYHASQYTDEAFAGLYIKDEKRFKSSLAAIHKYGMKALVYVGNSVSNFDRAFDTYADEWVIEPRGVPFVTPRVPNEKGYQACPRSGYIDYFYYRIGKLIDDYGVDGIFLDGRMESECRNTLHGCGVKNFDGELVAQRDVWDGLYKARFLYNVFENRNCYGEQHKSGNWNIPACFYWDGVWEGEQTMGVSLNGRRKLDFYPLEAMRGEINGIPFGMASRNTAYTLAPFTPLENCTYSFVHGTTWTMTYRAEEGLVVSPYWLAKDKFGATRRNFIGYWAPQPPAKAVCSDLLKVSAHVKPGQALIMVANFDEDKKFIQGKVTLDLNVLKIKKPVLRDAFSNRIVPIADDGTFEVKVKSFRQAWFVLSEK